MDALRQYRLGKAWEIEKTGGRVRIDTIIGEQER